MGFKTNKLLRPRRLRRRALAKAESAIQEHMDRLLRRRAQLVRSDPYGKLQIDKWTKEAQYFANEHICPKLTAAGNRGAAGPTSLREPFCANEG